MFTGIIECLGIIKKVNVHPNGNSEFVVQAPFVSELILGQSIAHNGVCLTVTHIGEQTFQVTAIPETLSRTNLGELKEGSTVNQEICMKADCIFDGHIIQGHVDTTAVCEKIEKK